MTDFKYSLRSLGVATAVLGFCLAEVHAQTPIAHWTFDEGIADYSVTTSDDTQQASPGASDAVWAGTGNEGLTYGAGQIGGAAFLDGESDTDHHFEMLEITAIDNNASGLTFTGWFQPSTTGQAGQNYKGVFMTRSVEDDTTATDPNNPGVANENWGFAWEQNGPNVDGRVSNLAVDSGNDVPNDGSWYHVALVWDPDLFGGFLNPTKSVYVNGVLADTDSANATTLIDSGTWAVGWDPSSGARHFRGGVDDIAIFGEVLNAGQISTLYNNGLGNGTTSTNAAGVTSTNILPGDTNQDGVDEFDYFTIRDNMNTVATGRVDGDVTGDGLVSLDDFIEWRNNASPAVLALAGVAVPEPTTLTLLVLFGVAGTSRRYHRQAV